MKPVPIVILSVGITLLAGCQTPDRIVIPPSRWEAAILLPGAPIPDFLPLTIDHTLADSDRNAMGLHGPVRTVAVRARLADPHADIGNTFDHDFEFAPDGRLLDPEDGVSGSAELIETAYSGYRNIRVVDELGSREFAFDLDGQLAQASRDGDSVFRTHWHDGGFALQCGPGSESTVYSLDARGRIQKADLSHRAHGMVLRPIIYNYTYQDDARGNWVELAITLDGGAGDVAPVRLWTVERTIQYHQ